MHPKMHIVIFIKLFNKGLQKTYIKHLQATTSHLQTRQWGCHHNAPSSKTWSSPSRPHGVPEHTSGPVDYKRAQHAHASEAAITIEQSTHLQGRDSHYPCQASCRRRYGASTLCSSIDASVVETPLRHVAETRRRSGIYDTAPLPDPSSGCSRTMLPGGKMTLSVAAVRYGDLGLGFPLE
jgi:hypothetical protein